MNLKSKVEKLEAAALASGDTMVEMPTSYTFVPYGHEMSETEKARLEEREIEERAKVGIPDAFVFVPFVSDEAAKATSRRERIV